MGGGYLSAPSVTIDPPLGQTAEGFANVGLDGAIDSITFTKTGVGYTTTTYSKVFANTIGDRDGESGFSTATGTIVLDNNQNNILRVNITNPGRLSGTLYCIGRRSYNSRKRRSWNILV